jgi:hypothetical protein
VIQDNTVVVAVLWEAWDIEDLWILDNIVVVAEW